MEVPETLSTKAPSASEFACLCDVAEILLAQLDTSRINSRAKDRILDFKAMRENRSS